MGISSEEITIPAGKARVLWVVLTVPGDTPTGAFTGTPVTARVNDSTDYGIDLTVNVPCWDTLDLHASEAKLWDYSYHPGGYDGEITGITDSDGMATARAARRTQADHNTLYLPIGVASRTSAGSSTPTGAFTTFVDTLVDEIGRYPLPSASSTRTIVLGMMYPNMFGPSWGSSSSTPAADWITRYGHLLTDLEAGLQDELEDPPIYRDVDDFEWVIIPVDEPTEASENLTLNGNSVTRADYFRAAAKVIRDFTSAHDMDPEIMVPHGGSDTSTYLVDSLEHCGHASNDCVDIWSYANWTDWGFVDHTLDGVVNDEFWWYTHTEPSAMRYAQAGWAMYENSSSSRRFSGMSSWAFWSANLLPRYSQACPADAGFQAVHGSKAAASYVVHSWEHSTPYLWGQQNQVYLPPSLDDSAWGWIPETEDLIPGRTLMSRRQALEFDRVLMKLDSVPGHALNGGGLAALEALIEDAVDDCHEDGSCSPALATTDDLMLVAHKWLDDVHACEDEPESTPYLGALGTVEDAMELDPWD